MDRIFAKPFLFSLPGHSDGISALAKSPNSLVNFLSGSFDGEIRFWDLSQRKTLFQLNAHLNLIKGLCFSKTGSMILSTGDDKIINIFDIDKCIKQKNKEVSNKLTSKYVLNNVDCCSKYDSFATSGQIVQIWNYNR